MKRLSDIAFQCYTDTNTDPSTALLVVKDGVYYDFFRAIEQKRNRIRRFFFNNYDHEVMGNT